jgi:hypothetical protein
MTDCERCNGCGLIADTDDGEPWTAWADLPPGSDLAVRMGLVKPISCLECGGTEPAANVTEAVSADDRNERNHG